MMRKKFKTSFSQT